jgi:DNA-binding transcriptional ArsR family regulator
VSTDAKRSRARRRFRDFNDFVDCSLATLTPSAVAAWLVIFRDVKADTGLARVGQADIARRAGVTDRTVRTALRELVDAGLLKVVRQGRLGAGPSVYKVRGANPDRFDQPEAGVRLQPEVRPPPPRKPASAVP